VASRKARLIGRVTNTEGSPLDISIALRGCFSTSGPSTNPSSIGVGLNPSFIQTRPMMPKIAVRQVSNELLFDAVRREARQKGLGDDHAGPPGAGTEQ
jgi:hypothetical protein